MVLRPVRDHRAALKTEAIFVDEVVEAFEAYARAELLAVHFDDVILKSAQVDVVALAPAVEVVRIERIGVVQFRFHLKDAVVEERGKQRGPSPDFLESNGQVRSGCGRAAAKGIAAVAWRR